MTCRKLGGGEGGGTRTPKTEECMLSLLSYSYYIYIYNARSSCVSSGLSTSFLGVPY